MSFFKKLFSFKSKRAISEEYSFSTFLESILGFYPNNLNVYREAFIHRSAQKKDEKGNNINFERLEFLGDALLGAVIAKHLYHESPNQKEGYLTKMRSKIVSRRQLNNIGENLNLVQHLSPKNNQSNLGKDVCGDLLEALIGAIFIDQGYLKAEKFILSKIIQSHIDLDRLESTIISHKSIVLEWSQKSKNILQFNTFEEENAEDLVIFVCIIRLNNKVISKGRGTSKKKAEENASKRAYYSLQKQIKIE